MIECLLHIIGSSSSFGDQARASLLEACKGLSSARPMHRTAIAPLLNHSHKNASANVRLAALEAIATAKDLIHFNLHRQVLEALWAARFDESNDNAELARQLYEKYSEMSNSKLSSDYLTSLVKNLDLDAPSVVAAGARALVGAMLEFPETQAATFEALFKIYKDNHPVVRDDKKSTKISRLLSIISWKCELK